MIDWTNFKAMITPSTSPDAGGLTYPKFKGNLEDWTKDSFVTSLFWMYCPSSDELELTSMIEYITELLLGKDITPGYNTEMYETGSRYYYCGQEKDRIYADTDYDYFGSSQMVGIWAIYFYLTGWELKSCPYHKGIYAKYNNNVINLITIKRNEYSKWFCASIATKSYIIDMLEKNEWVSKKNYLEIFENIRNITPEDKNNIKENSNKFKILSRLNVISIKKQRIHKPKPVTNYNTYNTYNAYPGIATAKPLAITTTPII